MQKSIHYLLLLIAFVSTSVYAGKNVVYEVDGQKYEGYYSAKSSNLLLILMIHNWDGLTEYEEKRADMLADIGYSVFAIDLFGKGVLVQQR